MTSAPMLSFTPGLLVGLGALLAGAGSLLSGVAALKTARRHGRREAAKRE